MSSTNGTNPIDDYLAQAKPAEAEVALCLDREIRDRHAIADLELARLLSRSPFGKTAAAKAEAADKLAAEQYEQAERVMAIETEMAEHETVFLLRSISWTERGVLSGLHPPREDVLTDRRVGYNRATLYPALVGKCIASITFPGKEPTPITAEQWERFAVVLEPEQMETLATVAVNLTWRPANPTSALASQTLSRASGAKSKQRARSVSRTDAS